MSNLVLIIGVSKLYIAELVEEMKIDALIVNVEKRIFDMDFNKMIDEGACPDCTYIYCECY
jgi:hypothetical protein